MKNTAKEKLHSVLNIIFYLMVTVSFIVPLMLVALCIVASSHLENQHWSVEWAIRVSLCLAIVETFAQILRTIKLFKNKK